MKPTIKTGAYGWRHDLWKNIFYPHDLPVAEDDDWRLTYYSNVFSAVLVPAGYWQGGAVSCSEQWMDAVHPDFQFYVECRIAIFDAISLADFQANLEKLQPQLSALVFPEDAPPMPLSLVNQLVTMGEQLKLDFFGLGDVTGKPVRRENNHGGSNFAIYENDLSDLRAARVMVEKFTAELEDNATTATIIVDHPRLTAENLSRFRSVLEIMGY